MVGAVRSRHFLRQQRLVLDRTENKRECGNANTELVGNPQLSTSCVIWCGIPIRGRKVSLCDLVCVLIRSLFAVCILCPSKGKAEILVIFPRRS
jgi:hypothetical protein